MAKHKLLKNLRFRKYQIRTRKFDIIRSECETITSVDPLKEPALPYLNTKPKCFNLNSKRKEISLSFNAIMKRSIQLYLYFTFHS